MIDFKPPTDNTCKADLIENERDPRRWPSNNELRYLTLTCGMNEISRTERIFLPYRLTNGNIENKLYDLNGRAKFKMAYFYKSSIAMIWS